MQLCVTFEVSLVPVLDFVCVIIPAGLHILSARATQGCHRSTIWTANYSAASAVSAVLADLCQEFGLSASSTQLWQADAELRPEQQLQAVRSNL